MQQDEIDQHYYRRLRVAGSDYGILFLLELFQSYWVQHLLEALLTHPRTRRLEYRVLEVEPQSIAASSSCYSIIPRERRWSETRWSQHQLCAWGQNSLTSQGGMSSKALWRVEEAVIPRVAMKFLTLSTDVLGIEKRTSSSSMSCRATRRVLASRTCRIAQHTKFYIVIRELGRQVKGIDITCSSASILATKIG